GIGDDSISYFLLDGYHSSERLIDGIEAQQPRLVAPFSWYHTVDMNIVHAERRSRIKVSLFFVTHAYRLYSAIDLGRVLILSYGDTSLCNRW
ncbi:MAG: hypothetical protein ACREBR_03540, partial [bacterium]